MNKNLYSRHRFPNHEDGFTIVELLIATVVMSLVLLLMTTAIIQITSTYYEGVTETSTQNAARNIINTVSQALEFQGSPFNPGNLPNGGTPTDTVAPNCPYHTPIEDPGCTYYFCIGDQEYIFQVGYEVETNPTAKQAYHGFVVELPNTDSCTDPGSNYLETTSALPAADDATDLLTPSMRLSQLTVTPLVCPPSLVNEQQTCNQPSNQLFEIDVQVTYGDDYFLTCPGDTTATDDCSPPTACNPDISTAFCFTSDVHTVVYRRVYRSN
jgi:type II secretory pathway pseudopilin PulG